MYDILRMCVCLYAVRMCVLYGVLVYVLCSGLVDTWDMMMLTCVWVVIVYDVVIVYHLCMGGHV